MRFCKLQGCGNDYIVIEADECRGRDLAELARGICDRHYGAGSDGITVVGALPTPGDFQVRIFNPDGSEAEISGNGTRCAAAYLYYSNQHQAETLRLHSVAGIKLFRLIERNEIRFVFETDMGQPRLRPALIPIDLPDTAEPVLSYPLEVGTTTLPISAISMGNPHCVVFVPELEAINVGELGRQLESHPIFPRRTNVEFAQVLDRANLAVRYYERGAGITLSSGSSSCAATVAAILNGLTDRRVQIHTLAGQLSVEWRDDDTVLLTGPAEFIYQGIWSK